jgi:hypothetical protein
MLKAGVLSPVVQDHISLETQNFQAISQSYWSQVGLGLLQIDLPINRE